MATPFDDARRAVAAYAVTPASPSSTSAGSDGTAEVGTFFGSELAVGRYDGVLGKLVARYPPVAYGRLLECLAVTCDEAVSVHLYVGSIAPQARLSSYGDGSLSEYDPQRPRYIPPGAALFVVWDVASSSSGGFANAQLRSA